MSDISNSSEILKTPISADQFDVVCDLLSQGTPILKAAKSIGVSHQSVYNYLEIIGEPAEKKWMRARAIYLESRMSERQDIIDKAKSEVLDCDPKQANALAQIYKEEIRAIEWEIARVISRKYGDRLDITSDHKALPVVVNVVAGKSTDNDSKQNQ